MYHTPSPFASQTTQLIILIPLKENGTYLSVAGENMLSNQIMQHKQAVLNGYMNAKQSASNDIDFWDKTLKKCKENFRDILKHNFLIR